MTKPTELKGKDKKTIQKLFKEMQEKAYKKGLTIKEGTIIIEKEQKTEVK